MFRAAAVQTSPETYCGLGVSLAALVFLKVEAGGRTSRLMYLLLLLTGFLLMAKQLLYFLGKIDQRGNT